MDIGASRPVLQRLPHLWGHSAASCPPIASSDDVNPRRDMNYGKSIRPGRLCFNLMARLTAFHSSLFLTATITIYRRRCSAVAALAFLLFTENISIVSYADLQFSSPLPGCYFRPVPSGGGTRQYWPDALSICSLVKLK